MIAGFLALRFAAVLQRLATVRQMANLARFLLPGIIGPAFLCAAAFTIPIRNGADKA